MKMAPKFPSLCRLEDWTKNQLRFVRILPCLAVLSLASIPPAAAQQASQSSTAQQPANPAPAIQQPATSQPAPQPPATSAPAESKPATPQQKQLADDTAKLLALANELKAELDRSNKDTLSLSVIRKAEQVEKLAHRVRDEMKASQQN